MRVITRRMCAALGIGAVTLGLGVGVSSVSADSALMKAAKEAGFPAQNCRYCHSVAMPKKDGFKAEDLNERGKWLVAEAKKKGTKPDAAWLKDYKGGPEQK